jgi:predicted enzyme related to lactoylglutathione lyase
MLLHGICTISLYAADLDAAKRWYADLLGVDAYFQVPGYVEFRVGDHSTEIGIIDSAYAGSELSRTAAPTDGPVGCVVFWHVDDLAAALERLTGLGAVALDPPRDRGEGFVTATVVDPFGNVLGIMDNPHYREVRAAGSDGP